MTVSDMTRMIERVEKARAQEQAFTQLGNVRASLRWGEWANKLYTQAHKEVRRYRRYCEKQPGRLGFLEGVVKNWEHRLKATRK
jgi:hypothetical protein